ncbi:MAG: hypothetical protein PHD67_03345 [Oscillospiraceae bacterium]|nr:hypothetical protein [Oscillospiraceae bacterium]
MADFLQAAFPWVVMGVAIALFCCNHAKMKRQNTDGGKQKTDDEKKADNRMAEGMSIGMCIGVAIGSTGVCSLATGVSLGMLIGMVAGMYMKK